MDRNVTGLIPKSFRSNFFSFFFREPAGELPVIVLSLQEKQHGPVYEGNRTENLTHNAFRLTTHTHASTQQALSLPNHRPTMARGKGTRTQDRVTTIAEQPRTTLTLGRHTSTYGPPIRGERAAGPDRT